jgi:Arc/MetJ family transcription regulator
MCKCYTSEDAMPTNLALDEKLLKSAMKLSVFKTKRETVNLALKEFIERRRQKNILDLQGEIDFREDWNYKKDRCSRESGR